MNKLRRFTQLDVAYSSVLVRLFYFLYYGGCACLFPFFTLYLRHLGLSAPQVGIVFGGKYMIWYLFGPLWIALAVRYDFVPFLSEQAIFRITALWYRIKVKDHLG